MNTVHIVSPDSFEGAQALETFAKMFETFICDARTVFEVKKNVSQGAKSFDSLAQVFQTYICNLITAIIRN